MKNIKNINFDILKSTFYDDGNLFKYEMLFILIFELSISFSYIFLKFKYFLTLYH